ncbi:MAG: hypothetical protein JNM69_09890 [Archangium sp.]|nr:hypothetical protein [Archangium sp.]
MSRALLVTALLAGCNMNVEVDPEGHRCNEIDLCPSGYTCVSFTCRANGSTGGGGGSGGGFVTMGGGDGGGFVTGGGDAGGAAGGVGGGSAGGGDLCANVSCTMVPAPTCVGSVARSFMGQGHCVPTTGQCSFESFDLDCAPGACVSGTCPLTVQQTGPRVRFAINAIDLAPGSTGSAVVAVGDRSNVSQWNGTRWATVSAPVGNVKLNAVNFTSQNTAWVVGEARTVWRWDRTTGTFLTTPAPSMPATSNLIGVDGTTDMAVLVADTSGNWAKWNGTAWANGALSVDGGVMTSVWVDETQRERIAGSCRDSSGVRRTCVGYRNAASSTTWFVDLAPTETRGCVSLGPWVDVPMAGGQDALCGFDDNSSIRHVSTGSYASTTGLSLLTGDGIVGITGAPPSAGTRAVWVQTSSILGTGRLYRVTGSGAAPFPIAQLDTELGEEHLSPSESAGVVVAEVDRVRNVNNVFYRRTTPVERTDALDLGLDFGAVTSFNGELALLGRNGELAVQHAGSDVYEFRRPPASPQYNVEDAEGRNSALSILVVGRDGLNAGLIGRVNFQGYTRVTTTAPSTTFRGVCRASDTEAWAVGTGGAVFSIGATAATREASVTTVNDFNAVDCPVVGQAVACGANSTVWRRSGGTWAPAPAFPMAGRTFTSCKLVNGAIWVAGDQVFARLDPQASSWAMLAARTGLNHLIIRAPNDIFATAAANTSNFDVVRYDGAAWTTVLSGTSGVPGGGVQVGARVVWGASAGALVEGR